MDRRANSTRLVHYLHFISPPRLSCSILITLHCLAIFIALTTIQTYLDSLLIRIAKLECKHHSLSLYICLW